MSITVQGVLPSRFRPLADELVRQIRIFGGGGAVSVWKDGEPIVDIWAGQRDRSGAAWRRDDVAMSFSTTKGVLMTALHLCVSRGLIDYDRPVADYWPEFAQNGKERITVRQLASHQAGLYKFPRGIHFSAARDWTPMAEALAAQRPDHKPGSACGYHAVTIAWLVGELIRRVDGRPIDRFVAEELAAPLGADGLFVALPRSAHDRVASAHAPKASRPKPTATRGKQGGRLMQVARQPIQRALRRQIRAFYTPGIGRMMFDPEYREIPVPSANGHFTARSLAAMYSMLANDGRLPDGSRLIDASVIAEATAVQTRKLDRIIGLPMHWRIGYHRVGRGRAFGHFGMGGSGGWASRRQRLAVAYVHNGDPMSLRGQTRMVGINRAIAAALGR